MFSNKFLSLKGLSSKIVLFLIMISMLVTNIMVDKGVFADSTEHVEDIVVRLYVGEEAYTINDIWHKADTSPYIESDRTFVPVRFVAEAFGAEADWGPVDKKTEWVSLEKEKISIGLTIGCPNLIVLSDEKEYVVTSDVAPHIKKDSRTFLPIRAVGEILGAEFDWGPKDGETEWVEFWITAKDDTNEEHPGDKVPVGEGDHSSGDGSGNSNGNGNEDSDNNSGGGNGNNNNDNGNENGTPPPSGGNDSPPPSGGGGTSPPNGGDSGEGGTGGDTPPSNGGGGNGENGNGENGNGEDGNGENGNGENGNGENGNGENGNGENGNGENGNGENGNGGPEDPDEYEVTFVEANSLVGVEIVVDGEDTITTNATGEAVIELADGLYDFTASLVGYDNYEGDFEVDGSTVTVDFEMIPEATEYIVTFDEDNNLEDVAIQVYSNAERTETVGNPVVTAFGGIATKDLEDGNYWFTASLAGYDNYEGDFTVSGVAKQVDFEMVAEVVEHTVTFDEDNNLEDVAIQVYSDAERTETVGNPVTTTDGGVATKELEDGNYWFTASLADHDDYEGDFTVSGVAKQVDFEMVESATLPEGVIPVASRADLEAIGSGEEHTFADGTGHQMTIEGTMDAEYIMVSDINLGGDDFEPIGHGDGSGHTEFIGTFDGNGHEINELTIYYSDHGFIGLFACNGSDGTIENVQIEDADIKGDANVGALAGHNKGVILNSHSTGSVEGESQVGGLVGSKAFDSTVSNSYSTANVISTSEYAGGLVGRNFGTISNSHSTSEVNGSRRTGGLVGGNFGTISNSHSTGAVSGTDFNTGGLVGWNDGGDISNSYSTGVVTGNTQRTGGLVGENNGGTISNSYSTGAVDGHTVTGGLVGENEGTISNSYSTGSVDGNSQVGGLVGTNTGPITNSYWDTEASGQGSSAGGDGRTTDQMQQGTADSEVGGQEIYTGWLSPPWNFGGATDYPTLNWE